MASDGSKTMSFLNEDVLFHGLSMTIDLIPRVCVAVIAAYVSMRVKVLRQALNNKQLHWRHQIVAAVFFGLLAIIGTHSGIKVDIHQAEALVDRSLGVFFVLQPSQAIIGFRDLMVFTAGLFGGVWIGLGAGLLAGLERYSIVGDFRIAGLGTIILGLGAGLSRQFWPRWTTSVTGILSVSLVGTLLLASMLFVFIHPHDYAIAIVREMIISESLVNSLGCLLFMVVMKDLESDQLKIEAQQAELRALQAQIEPHFLNNTFNAIQALINIDPHIASEYVVKLARFMDQTRQNAGVNAITLAQELAQLRFYLDFQSLRFPGKFRLIEKLPDSLLACYISPRSLQTLAENALIHGRRGKDGVLDITLTGADNGATLQLSVHDNGGGISPERLEQLGKHVVKSDRGGGSALYQMRESLNLAFDGRATLDIRSQLSIETEVILTLPKRSKAW